MNLFSANFFTISMSLVRRVSLKMQQFESSKKYLWVFKIWRKFMDDCSTRIYFWLIVALLLCVVFALPFYASEFNKKAHNHEENDMKMRSIDFARTKLLVNTSSCAFEDCSFFCKNSSDLTTSLLVAVQESNCATVDILYIEQQSFSSQILGNDWIRSHTTFSEVVLAYNNITKISNEAFNNEAFTATFSLSLINLPIKNLSAGVLLGLSKLEYLTISCQLENIDRGFFQPVSSSLHSLRLNQMTKSVRFDKIFGISKMMSLVFLDLSSNNFGDLITMQGFRRLSKVKNLNLSNSKITSIGRNAFEPIKSTLKYLDLSRNLLKRIEVETFDSILSSGRAYIYLSDNPWFCDCQLQPLIEYYHKYSDRFLDRPYCKYPRKHYGIAITEELLCQMEPTVSQNSTDRTSPIQNYSTSTDYPDVTTEYTDSRVIPNTGTSPAISSNNTKFLKMACVDPKEMKSSPIRSSNYQYLTFMPPRYNFSIVLLNSSSVEIVIQQLDSQLSILWHSDLDDVNSMNVPESEYGCQSLSNKSIIVNNLQDNVSYTFCLIPDGETSVTPFNCQPFHIPVKEPKGWITHDKKHAIIALITIILLASTCTGGVVSYFLIKSYPDLLKGSKHVLLVKKSTAQYISTISGMDDMLQTCESYPEKSTPLPPYQNETDETDYLESTYESPLDIKGYEIPRRHTYSFDKFESFDHSPKSPPPLPKRNSAPNNNIKESNKLFQFRTSFVDI